MEQRIIYILILLAVPFVQCDSLHYIVPSANGTQCPSRNECYVLSDISNITSMISESNTTFLFLPGNHTLTSNVIISGLSYFTMAASGNGLHRPVINCEEVTKLYLSSINYFKVDGLNLKWCIKIVIDTANKVLINESTFLGNQRQMGSVIVVIKSTLFVVGSLFESISGKVLYLARSNAHIMNCTFANNSGGALLIEDSCNVTINNSAFSLHTMRSVISSTESSLYIMNCVFDRNQFPPKIYNNQLVMSVEGGAITLLQGNGSILNCSFTNHMALSGAAIAVGRDTFVNISESYFGHNTLFGDYEKSRVGVTIPGGVVHCRLCKMEIARTLFEYNKGDKFSGALLVFQGHIRIKSCRFSHNSADEFGGGFYAVYRTEAVISNTTFENNVAQYGAAFHAFVSRVIVTSKLSVFNNTAYVLGAIGIIHSIATLKGRVWFENNIGSLYVYSGEVHISSKFQFGYATFTNNNQVKDKTLKNFTGESGMLNEGGGITLFVSRLELQTPTRLSYNIARNGGGILAITSTIVCNTTLTVYGNTATDTGVGLYLYQCELSIFNYVLLSYNKAMRSGGGIHAVNTFIKLICIHVGLTGTVRGKIKFVSNTARKFGGGAFFEVGSKIYVLQYMSSRIEFSNNSAEYGGALYLSDDTYSGTCASGQTHTLTGSTQSECFFQLLTVSKTKPISTIRDFVLRKNHAKYSGADLFGGLLDRCTVRNHSKIVKYSSIERFADYIIDSSSSEPVRICLCNSDKQVDCSIQSLTITTKKDEMFIVHLAAVDHLNHTLNATIHTYAKSNQGSLGEEQHIQYVGSDCDNVSLSLVSPKQSEELVIYAEGPCKDLGISPLHITVNFIPCYCPLGFEQYKTIKNKCVCICHHKLQNIFKFLRDSDCNSTTLHIARKRDFWMARTTNETLLTVKQCPSDYCHSTSPPVYLDLSNTNGADAQCKFNRSGVLCGDCKNGLTLSLGSPRCLECPKYWPALLITIIVSAILAGIAVVTIMLAFNLTVAKGTLNGIIFYSNVLAANQGLFLHYEHLNFLSLFIAWLNFDIGFDVCFVKGI